MSLNMLIFCPV